MMAETGRLALILAAMLALGMGTVCLTAPQHRACRHWARPAVGVLTALMAMALASLAAAFIQHDFSLPYVVRHSGATLPLPYRIAAVWGGHEGAMLLWVVLLSFWTLALTFGLKAWPARLKARTLGVLLWLVAGFLLFLLFASDPFERLLTSASEGRDLNPLLQNPAMVLHPPLLFLGTAGLAVPYALALAALLEGQCEPDWLHTLRAWLAAAWMFLTLGIALGAWWAYTELGWGGWWSWDPVENAALMPWLAATALLHMLVVSRQRGHFRHWTLLLALLPFMLVLLATFLVRSGILTSMHAFATDPKRGVFLLILLALVVGGALALYARRAPALAQRGIAKPWSRQTLLLAASLLLLVACATVLLGTFYPLLLQTLGLGRISVGPPYFNRMFALLMAPALMLMLTVPFAGSKRESRRGSRLAMFLAHLGIVLLALGAVRSSSGGVLREVRMALDETVAVAGYRLKWQDVQGVEGSNYLALRGQFEWSANGSGGVLQPEKRRYSSLPVWMTETAIDSTLWRDLHVSLGEPVDRAQPFGAWTVRVQVRPMMNLVWAGLAFMVLGGIAAIRRQKPEGVVAEARGAQSAPEECD